MPSYISALISIISLLIILATAYWASKWIALKSQRFSSGIYMEVIDRLIIGNDKSIILLKVGQKIFMLANTNQQIEKIAELLPSDLVLLKKEQKAVGFHTILATYFKKTDESILQDPEGNSDAISNISKQIFRRFEKLNAYRNIYSNEEEDDK